MVVADPWFSLFFLTAASVADIAADNPNVSKTLLADAILMVNQLLLRPKKLRNPPPWVVIFVVVPFNKIPLISNYLITFKYPLFHYLLELLLNLQE